MLAASIKRPVRASDNDNIDSGVADCCAEDGAISSGANNNTVGDNQNKNLLKVKIIQKLTRSKKSDFAKSKKPDPTNKAFKIDLFTSRA